MFHSVNLSQVCPQDDALYMPIDCQRIVQKYSKVFLLREMKLAAFQWEIRGKSQLLPISYDSQIGGVWDSVEVGSP